MKIKKSQPTHTPGFFLLELMVVLALFAFVVSLSFLNDSLLTKSQLRAEIDKLYAAISYGHRCALASGKEEFLVFDSKKNMYSCNGRSEKLPRGIMFGASTETKGPPSTPTHPISSPITFINEHITFNPTGIMQAGTVYMTDEKKRYVYALSIPVGHVSHIRKYMFHNSTWQLI